MTFLSLSSAKRSMAPPPLSAACATAGLSEDRTPPRSLRSRTRGRGNFQKASFAATKVQKEPAATQLYVGWTVSEWGRIWTNHRRCDCRFAQLQMSETSWDVLAKAAGSQRARGSSEGQVKPSEREWLLRLGSGHRSIGRSVASDGRGIQMARELLQLHVTGFERQEQYWERHMEHYINLMARKTGHVFS